MAAPVPTPEITLPIDMTAMLLARLSKTGPTIRKTVAARMVNNRPSFVEQGPDASAPISPPRVYMEEIML